MIPVFCIFMWFLWTDTLATIQASIFPEDLCELFSVMLPKRVCAPSLANTGSLLSVRHCTKIRNPPIIVGQWGYWSLSFGLDFVSQACIMSQTVAALNWIMPSWWLAMVKNQMARNTGWPRTGINNQKAFMSETLKESTVGQVALGCRFQQFTSIF